MTRTRVDCFLLFGNFFYREKLFREIVDGFAYFLRLRIQTAFELYYSFTLPSIGSFLNYDFLNLSFIRRLVFYSLILNKYRSRTHLIKQTRNLQLDMQYACCSYMVVLKMKSE